MSIRDSEREPQVIFKHRIVGAVVLVALAVVILPVILNATAPVAQERSAPAADGGRDGTKLFVSRITPAGEGTKPEPVHKTVSGPLSPAAALPPVSAGPEPVPVIPPKAESKTAEVPAQKAKSSPSVPTGRGAAAPADAATTATKANDGKKSADTAASKTPQPVARAGEKAEDRQTLRVKSGWIVQAGVFVQRENADRIAARLKAAGQRPTVGPVTYRGKNYFRVYVGPYATQDEARRMSGRVAQSIHEKVAVVAYP